MLNGGLPGARWITPENYHLTVRFIGEVDEGLAEDIDGALAVIRARPFDLVLQGVGAFGRGRQVHSLWAGVVEDDALLTLHDKIDQALRRIGLPPERRKFSPHVTLARLKRANSARVEEFKASHAMFAAEPFMVENFVLFSSLLSRGGAIYRAEASYPLTAD